jgi:hypothetical protein
MSPCAQEHDKAITMQRLEFERECRELQGQYEERMKTVRLSLESQRSSDIRVIDELKARHVASLTKAHEIAFQVSWHTRIHPLCGAFGAVSACTGTWASTHHPSA